MLLAVLLLLLVVVKEGTKEQTQNIRVGEVTHSLFYAPLYVGVEKDF